METLDKEDIKEACTVISERVRRSILTLGAVHTTDGHMMAKKRHGVDYKTEWDAYSSEDCAKSRFQPTPQDIDRYLDDLAWLNILGDRATKIIWLKAYGIPGWKIGEKYGGVDRRTVNRWYKDGIKAIYQRFGKELT